MTDTVLAFSVPLDGSASELVEGPGLVLEAADDMAPLAGLEPSSGERSSWLLADAIL